MKTEFTSVASSFAIMKSRRVALCKRTFDVVASVFLLSVSWPIILLMAFMLRLESKGNPFFCQTRIGRNGDRFRLIKMRTLYSHLFIIDTENELAIDDARVTKIGRLLRRTKLDELPQLWNILIGDMSFVGPRPDIPEQVANYNDGQLQRLRMRPGLTGAAQVSGNTAMSWPERIDIDNWYIDNHSLLLDLKILMLTPFAIYRGEGAKSNPSICESMHLIMV